MSGVGPGPCRLRPARGGRRVEAMDPAAIRAALQAARGEDAHFHDGGILGSMCTAPHELAAWAASLFQETNLGDPAHFPGTARLEREVLEDLAQLTGASGPEAVRYLTGGTEANLLACYLAREGGASRIVVPDSAHFSFDKAARLLRMDLVRVPTVAHRADPGAMSEHADEAVLVGVAGSTELGLVDPIEALAAAAREAGCPLHVDAAFGGYVLPFLPNAPPHDLRVEGVTSIGLDPHKMGMSVIPGGALAVADAATWDTVAVETDYVSTERQSTLMGTRPGAAAAATWAVHRALGWPGYEAVVQRCMDTTRQLASGLRALGAELVAEPELNVVTFRWGDADTTAKELAAAGFRLNVVPRFGALRIVVNPHVTPEAATRFLAHVGRLKAANP